MTLFAHFDSKMNVILRTSTKNCVNKDYFRKKIFSFKKSPEGDHRSIFVKKWPEGYHRSVFEGKDFSFKKIFSGAVFRADSEYNIRFVFNRY